MRLISKFRLSKFRLARFRLARFRRSTSGAVSVIAAITFPVVIGMVGLAVEYGYGLLMKADNQRIADLAAYAGATAYNNTGSTTTMTTVATNVAVLNGIPSPNVSVALTTSPRSSSSSAVQVNITTTEVLLLAPILNGQRSMPVSSHSYAQINAGTQACILALAASGTGVTLSGGTSVSASSCGVASNNTVTVPCGTAITAKSVSYNSGAAPSQPCSGITGTIKKQKTTDPLASSTGVSTGTARLSTVSAMTAPTAPAGSSVIDLNFDWGVTATAQALLGGCVAVGLLGQWNVTCASGGTYNFRNVTVAGGVTVNFNTAGSASTTYVFSGSINNTGTALNFGPGTYKIAGGLTTGGGTTTTFGAGTFIIGPSATACNYTGGKYSICNTGTILTFGGPSTFQLSAGLYNNGGSKITLGSGSTNSYSFGASSDGNALYIGGGAITTFADATGSSNLYQFVGNVNAASGGGNCLTLGAASQHDINGYFSSAGGTSLGAGVYTVTGYFALGANGGGDVTCNGSYFGLVGTGVNLVLGGASTPTSGTCSGYVFCLAGGFSNVTLTAPTSGTMANLAIIGPTSNSITGGALFSEGASSTSLSGALYFPNGPISLTGGSSVGDKTGQCLQMIGSSVTLSGGTAAASSCLASTSTAGNIQLVQ